MIEVRAACVEDAIDLAPRLRRMDLGELIRDEDSDPKQSLIDAVAKSYESWTYLHNGKVFAIGGICEGEDGSGIIWQLGSDEVAKHRKDFLLVSRELVDGYKEMFELIHNFVGQNSHESKRYLRWLGFVIDPGIVTVGSRQVPFQYFWWRRGDEDV